MHKRPPQLRLRVQRLVGQKSCVCYVGAGLFDGCFFVQRDHHVGAEGLVEGAGAVVGVAGQHVETRGFCACSSARGEGGGGGGE